METVRAHPKVVMLALASGTATVAETVASLADLLESHLEHY